MTRELRRTCWAPSCSKQLYFQCKKSLENRYDPPPNPTCGLSPHVLAVFCLLWDYVHNQEMDFFLQSSALSCPSACLESFGDNSPCQVDALKSPENKLDRC